MKIIKGLIGGTLLALLNVVCVVVVYLLILKFFEYNFYVLGAVGIIFTPIFFYQGYKRTYNYDLSNLKNINLISWFQHLSLPIQLFLILLLAYEVLLITLSTRISSISRSTGLRGFEGLIDSFDYHYFYTILLPLIVFIFLRLFLWVYKGYQSKIVQTNQVQANPTELKQPITLVGSIRDWNDSAVALAATNDGGASVVLWSRVKSSWVETEAVSTAKLLSLPLLDESQADVILKNIKLKEPVVLTSSIREKAAGAVALAQTEDGGEIPVAWASPSSKWILYSRLTVGDVLGSPPLTNSDILLEIDRTTKRDAEMRAMVEASASKHLKDS